MEKPLKITDIASFQAENPSVEIVDQHTALLDELFLIRNPAAKMKKDYSAELSSFKQALAADLSINGNGEWFYFPWSKLVVHYLPDAWHQEIRTARNKNIITKEEQEKLYNTTIAVAGLSVGSHAALTINMMGMAKHIKLADQDEISASNLNRLSYDFTKIGKNKAETVAEHIYQVNPYAEVEVFSKGVAENGIGEFLDRVDILVEEMDNLPMKVAIRKKAQELGIPVLMATDNGNSVIVDIERFDTDKQYPLFHGRTQISEEDLSPTARQTNPKQWNKISSEIIGIEFMEKELILSLAQIGKTVGGVPQLGAAATMAGGLIAIGAARIALGKSLNSGKYIFSTDELFSADYTEASIVKDRDAVRNDFKNFLNS